jgi:hypothetical protein
MPVAAALSSTGRLLALWEHLGIGTAHVRDLDPG